MKTICAHKFPIERPGNLDIEVLYLSEEPSIRMSATGKLVEMLGERKKTIGSGSEIDQGVLQHSNLAITLLLALPCIQTRIFILYFSPVFMSELWLLQKTNSSASEWIPGNPGLLNLEPQSALTVGLTSRALTTWESAHTWRCWGHHSTFILFIDCGRVQNFLGFHPNRKSNRQLFNENNAPPDKNPADKPKRNQ